MTLLQPLASFDRAAFVRADHYLPSRPDTVQWGRLPNAASAPVLKVRSGETVCIDTVSHEGLLEDQGGDPAAFFGANGIGEVLDDAVRIARECVRAQGAGPHVVTGPVHVAGAEPGDVLEVEVLQLERRAPYGVVSNRHGRGALAGEYPLGEGTVSTVATVDGRGRGVIPVGDGRSLRFGLAPFLGIMGTAPDTADPVHSVPPGPHGGNLDIRLLGEGAKLYLPVAVPGASFYCGDPHFSQGDGEVALTAFEAPLRAVLRLTVHADPDVRRLAAALGGPYAETGEHWITTGLDEDLDEAVRKATRAALAFLRERRGIPGPVALAYLSAAVDVRISQVVDLVKGAHVTLPKELDLD
ncbi:acetamidase/formamidase family protein [Glycomyces mayteni]|uniref:Acetamidase/formamidase family protein n=1 Tax=Glycomyces mayteni TaxID=543887 RepID=A0ABW2DAG1_9ACTN|nr:acetamidase/formamidase family protein [Glycomyces mayteni]